MNKYKETFETWNKMADLYESKFMNLDLYNDTYDFFCSELHELNSKILEIGCGPGNIAKYILSKRPDFNILGIDIAPNMVKLAKKNNPIANFEVMDIRNISNLKTIFNGIICGFCLPYLSKLDCSNLFKDCNNLLSKNGILYLSFVEGEYADSGYKTGNNDNKVFFYYHSLKYIEKELIKNNFRIIDLKKKNYTNSDIHTIIIAKKEKL